MFYGMSFCVKMDADRQAQKWKKICGAGSARCSTHTQLVTYRKMIALFCFSPDPTSLEPKNETNRAVGPYAKVGE